MCIRDRSKLTLTARSALDIESDAIVFSTNEQLLLTGGVGAALLNRFGEPFQDAVSANIRGRDVAQCGDVFQFSSTITPWRHHFAVVAVDLSYHVSRVTIDSILTNVLTTCSVSHDVRHVVTSALGTGYGDLPMPDFVDSLLAALSPDDPFSVTLALNSDDSLAVCTQHLDRAAPDAYVVS